MQTNPTPDGKTLALAIIARFSLEYRTLKAKEQRTPAEERRLRELTVQRRALLK